MFIRCHIAAAAVVKFIVGFSISARYPTRFVQIHGFVVATCAVFALHSVLNNFKLQRPNGADNLSTIHIAVEELRHTFVHELVESLLKRFAF